MNLNLYDIKELSDIPDNSFFMLIVLLLVGFVFIIAIIILIKTKIKNRSKIKTLHDEAVEKLNKINLNDTKKSAYIITKYARVLIHDQRSKKLYDELYHSLEKYKYAQIVPRFEHDIINKLNLFKESVGIY